MIRLPLPAMQEKVVVAAMLCWCFFGAAIVVGFTLARSVPPDWVLGVFVVSIGGVLVGVVVGNRHRPS